MEAVTNDLKLFEEYAQRVRVNIKKFEELIRSENASNDASNITVNVPIASDETEIASDEVTASSNPMPTKLLEEATKPLELPVEVSTKPLEQKPTVLPKDKPSEIVPIPPDTAPDVVSDLCARCKKALKPKRARKSRTKAQQEASRKNLAKRWQKEKKQLEAIPEKPEESVVNVVEEDDWRPPPAPRRMVGKRQAPVPVRNPFDSAF